ncbi:MAG: membrane protein insertion efficiency factor YidD [Myxococcota bacterium]
MSARARPRLGVGPAILIGLITLYRWTLAWLLGGQCRFHPSCSVYAGEAIRRHGAWRGVRLTFGRIFRCHPWNPGGVDPVPQSTVQRGKLP